MEVNFCSYLPSGKNKVRHANSRLEFLPNSGSDFIGIFYATYSIPTLANRILGRIWEEI